MKDNMFGDRPIYILFGRHWGGEDINDNGLAVRLVNEAVEKIGYKDIAY
ncbi:MAG TPA: DUF2004 domain-containing protein [Clostridium sp.]|mgnify:CR=1 FL=1|jgi:hypothetical protein|nr:DUF2004 domain-containing protein [Clostridium sp.]